MPMKPEQQIETTQRNGNLHIDLPGHITPGVATELPDVIRRAYRGQGNIFIHTKRVISVAPDSKRIFAECIQSAGLPQDNLYLTGSKGLEFSPDNIRVIVPSKKKSRCGGSCKDCPSHPR